MKKYFISLLLFAGFFLLATVASAQWKLATGFSNSNGLYNSDDITGFAVWGNSILAHATCGFDGSQPGATGDSLFLSTDNGQTWTGYASNGVLPMLVVGTGSTAIFYANTAPIGTNNGKVLSYSSDGAQTWVTDTTGLTVQGFGGGYASSVVAIGNNVFTSDGIGVYKQTALGAAWAVDTTGLGLGSTVAFYQVGSMVTSGNNLILNTGFTSLFQSANGGTWTAANNGLPTFTSHSIHQWYPVGAFATSGSSVYAQVAHDSNQFGGADLYSSDFYRTTDGTNWTKMNSAPLNYWGGTQGFAASGNDLFTVTDSGFFASTDNGVTWTKQNQGLPASGAQNFEAIVVLNGNVVIGTQYNGAYYRALSDFGGASVGNVITNSISLSESYPNPVNSSSKINYSLISDGMASLILFDITGKQIAVLANGYQYAGDHTTNFDGSALPSGMYFYRLTTPEGSIGHWLQLIK
jgi:hypothetical protein